MNKQERRYILFAGIFAMVYFLLILPNIIKSFGTGNPLFQFVAFNVGVYFFFFIFLKSITTSRKIKFSAAFGLLTLFLALDTLLPEYHVGYDGKLISGGLLGVSTTDYIFGLLATSIGFKGIAVYLITYVIMPVILLYIASRIFPNFIKHL